jgi:sortase B
MKAFRIIAAAALIAVIAISGLSALQIQKGYTAEEAASKEVAPYRPIMPVVAETDEQEPYVNQGILDLQVKYPDAIGWITIPHTGIDYPFVQSEDNDEYLQKDIDGNFAVAGTLFLDCLSSSDFSDFNTIIYGHHMKNGTMFGPINMFGDEEFFNTNKTGTIFLEDKTYTMEFFAYIVVRSDDLAVYDSPTNSSDIGSSLDYIRENARYYRDIGVGTGDHIVTLSTCAYEFKDARMLLIGKLTQL